MTRQPHLDGLNPEQRAAVEHFEGPLLVLAGAGSGKTRVLTVRVCHLVREWGVAPDRILAVTFTNKAAGEMRSRIHALLGAEPAGMWIGTFHAVGARMLRRAADRLGWDRAFSIYDADQSLRLLKEVVEEAGLDPKRWNPKAFRSSMSDAKNQLVDPESFARERADGFGPFFRHLAELYPRYQDALRERNAFDFDDLLVKPVELLDAHPGILDGYRDRFQFLLVDEYQDTNRAQFRLVELLAGARGNVMVVGDDDQSIYGWRGADVRNILDFETSYPGATVVRLERNYRSTRTILDGANALIAENVRRKGKTLRTDRDGGEPISVVETFDETDEARWIVRDARARLEGDATLTLGSFAVLYRTNAQARALEDACLRDGLPYQVVGSVRFYERREIQDVLAYLRLISNPRDTVAFARVVNYPRRGVGQASLARLGAWAAERGVTPLDAASRAAEVAGVSGRAATGLRDFAELVGRYRSRAPEEPVGALVEELVVELDLERHLEEEGSDGEDRVRNVAELVAGALDFDAAALAAEEGEGPDAFGELDLFLQQVALVADVDRLDPDAEAVTLMTLHNAKGLEFPIVYLAGMEEGLFPLSRATETVEGVEEERRLLYVGMTRAEDKLTLTWARQRRRAGDFTYGTPSSFLTAIPPELLDERRSDRLALTSDSTPHRRRRDRWGVGGGSDRAGFDVADGDDVFDQDPPRFVKGERVVHSTFGPGAVQAVSGFGRDLRVVVDFDRAGRKKLLARYAGLEKDWP